MCKRLRASIPDEIVPDMQIVDVCDIFSLRGSSFRRRGLYAGGSFEQDIDRFADQPPRAQDDDQADQDTPETVGPYPAERQIRRPAMIAATDPEDHRPHGATRRAYSDRAVVAVKQIGRDQIDDQTADGDKRQRKPELRGGRSRHTSLKNHPARDQDQGDAVDKSRENLETVVAVGLIGGGRPCRKPDRRQRQSQRGDIREHMAGIGEQASELVSQPPTASANI